jgi:hypothetical protein
MGFDEKVVVWVRARSCNSTFHKTIEVSSTKKLGLPIKMKMGRRVEGLERAWKVA